MCVGYPFGMGCVVSQNINQPYLSFALQFLLKTKNNKRYASLKPKSHRQSGTDIILFFTIHLVSLTPITNLLLELRLGQKIYYFFLLFKV